MWRRHTQKVSRAEEAILAELCRRGLGRGLSTQHGIKFDGKTEGVKGTWIDFSWTHPVMLAAFLDGPLHLKSRQQTKDELIDKALQRRGYAVARYRYKPPISKRRLKEIVDHIEKRLKHGIQGEG